MGSRLRPWVAGALVATVAAAAGCYWLKYDRLARTHVDLLAAMAEKLGDVTRDHGRPPAGLAEYRYPLERARDFTRIAARRFEGRASLAALRRLCADYEAALAAAERLRAQPPGAGLAALAEALDGVRERAREARAALDREAAGV
jgi:hypothetical protein